MKDCKYCIDEICCNADCSYCCDYCPVTEFPEICKYAEEQKDGEVIKEDGRKVI